ncbi:low molecular weight phosphotyrosine protein phosphatase [Alteromonadaceae bacterium M269]|nr:low molecular weight phosphotyrosine protein phosphatase [Alteromonadaceae bacterium M269]
MTQKKTSFLFVCMGNICRSPTAEAVFKKKAQERALDFFIDSAGTIGHHRGHAPDKRSQQVGMARGYDFKGMKSRKVEVEDFSKFDYVVAMDNANLSDLIDLCPEDLRHKVSLMMSHTQTDFDEVPDPYYGGGKGFELVLDLIEQASDGLLDKVS